MIAIRLKKEAVTVSVSDVFYPSFAYSVINAWWRRNNTRLRLEKFSSHSSKPDRTSSETCTGQRWENLSQGILTKTPESLWLSSRPSGRVHPTPQPSQHSVSSSQPSSMPSAFPPTPGHLFSHTPSQVVFRSIVEHCKWQATHYQLLLWLLGNAVFFTWRPVLFPVL